MSDETKLIANVVEAIQRRSLANDASEKARIEAADARTAEQAAWTALRDYQDRQVSAALAAKQQAAAE